MQVSAIYRFPVKGFGYESLESVALSAGWAMPFDRLYALTHAKSDYPTAGEWARCRNFMRTANAPKLAQVRIDVDAERRTLRVSHPEREAIEADLGVEAGRAALAAWLEPLAAPVIEPPYAIVDAADGVYFGDDPRPAVSLLNRASLRALSEQAGQTLDERRFRGNLWIDGDAPWAEFDWIGREVTIGGARLKVLDRIERCMATAANPETGERDVPPVRVLRSAYDHSDFGVLAEVVSGGPVAVGDAVSTER